MSATTAAPDVFAGVQIQGGLLPADLLSRLATGRDIAHLDSADFHLAAGETVRDAANRVWSYLRGVWAGYRAELDGLPEGAPTTALTRERLLLVLLDQLGYGRVPTTGKGGLVAGGESFPVSHLWGPVPIHLLGADVSLDTRTKGVAGAAGQSPQSMVQELLNRTDEYLWAIVANGRRLRLLRDSTSLVGAAYVEFDLEAIFDGDLFADFLLLFTLCHQSRLETRDEQVGPASCRLETWRTTAIESGSRALNLLRDGVVEALRTLGTGFLTDPANTDLREDLNSGRISVDDVNHALLRVTYRLLFTFVAEDRGALLDPAGDPVARARYRDYFSTAKLRAAARRRHGTGHSDRWQALTLIWRGLGSPEGLERLALPGIGGLFEDGPLDFLTEHRLPNHALLAAVRSLSLVTEPGSGTRRVVDYRNLGAEELGSIYEALLEFVPGWDPEAREYRLEIAAGNQRKDTGSYYTPTALVESLMDTALDPVLDRAVASATDAEGKIAALLEVTVCDPACGSGHFLVGAARRIAKRVAALETGDLEPAAEPMRAALRRVVSRCVYGVDVNPLAAELAKISLWLEALEPGRPLAYLDGQIKVGNALLGTTPALLAGDLPDAAFKALEGDDKTVATETARANRAERKAQGGLFTLGAALDTAGLAADVAQAIGAPALTLDDVHTQAARLRAMRDSGTYRRARTAADAWCAAFVWPLRPGAPTPITQDGLAALVAGRDVLDARQQEELGRLTAEYRFFHWHLEFPHIFRTEPAAGERLDPATGWAGGFSVLLGNPPWETIELKEQEFFSGVDEQIAEAPGAKRKKLIAALETKNPPLHRSYTAAKRRIDGQRHFAAQSGRYPLTGHGRIKTDPLFAESGRQLIRGNGRFGMILPTAIATDYTTRRFFKDIVETDTIVSLYDFENAKPLFVGVHRSFKFALLTLAGRDERVPEAEFAFFAHDPTDLQREDVRFTLSPEEITLLNPNTGTCPVFRSRRDAEITLGIYKRVPVLINENDPVNGNPWGISFMQGLFNMTSDSHLFHTREQLENDGWVLRGNVFEKPGTDPVERMLPLYEAKMIHHFDHQWATYEPDGTTRLVTAEEKADPNFHVMPRYWVTEPMVEQRLQGRSNHDWLLGWRDICRSTDERTMIATQFPRSAVGHTLPLAFHNGDSLFLQVNWSSFAFDYVARQKVGGTHMTYNYLSQLPCPKPPTPGDGNNPFLEHFSKIKATPNKSLDGIFRADINAAMFHIYGIDRNDISYIMDTFPIVKRKDEEKYGEYRTKRLILEAYDAMAEAAATGVPYGSPLAAESGEIDD